MAHAVEASLHRQLCAHEQHKVAIANIQQELDALWHRTRQQLAAGRTVTRASMSNLIIYCDDESQSREIEQAIPGIVLTHPARVIVLSGSGDTTEPGIEAYVSGLYTDHGNGCQVCAEQINLVADNDSGRRLPSVTRAQLIGDLPTTLWWASLQPPPFAGKLFFKLADMSDQIIYDSIGWTNPSHGMQAMSRWVAAERNDYVIYNLAWRRLKPWRRLLGQVLDPRVHPGALEGVSGIEIEHGPHALAMATLLLGWLVSRLGWETVGGKVVTGKQTVWQFSSQGRAFQVTIRRLPAGEATPQSLHWHWRDKEGTHKAVFALLGDERLGIVADDSDVPVRVIYAPTLSRSELVSSQMAHRSRDKIFEQALAAGHVMTSVLGN